jgi:hypothetical protein
MCQTTWGLRLLAGSSIVRPRRSPRHTVQAVVHMGYSPQSDLFILRTRRGWDLVALESLTEKGPEGLWCPSRPFFHPSGPQLPDLQVHLDRAFVAVARP